jgi:DNA gyrase subunit B
LLTFFYRQMPELIDRGHIYIGQPPLYKIKQGKQEHYLKDDNELNDYLLARALDNASLVFDPEAPPLGSEALENLMRDYLASQLAVQRLSKRFDPSFLEHLIDYKSFSLDWPEAEMAQWCAPLQDRLNANSPPSVRYELSVVKGEEGPELLLSRITHGVSDARVINSDFFNGAEYRLIGKLADTLHGLIQEGATVHRGKSSQAVSSFREAYDWLMAESRKGRSIQRFKGLGEMNPDQLWDTTVNPETRRLLKVTIEDAVAADQIFTTLMGDEVEPRREFIERNALDVANLDV